MQLMACLLPAHMIPNHAPLARLDLGRAPADLPSFAKLLAIHKISQSSGTVMPVDALPLPFAVFPLPPVWLAPFPFALGAAELLMSDLYPP